MVIGDVEPLADAPPGVAVTVNEVIGLVPGFAGGANDTNAEPFPGDALMFVGASGAAGESGVTDAEEDGVPTPCELTASSSME
jgi:hypothetical protein